LKIEISNIMSQVKFQKLINDFSPASLTEVFKSHEIFRIKENTLASFNKEQFTEFTQLGDFDLEDNTNIIVVCARSLTPLNERSSRKNQYDLSKKVLKNFIKARAGIFVYYDNKGDFRMSLIYADYVGIRINYSTFRRFTYFVSKDQKNVTFLQQVASLKFTNFKELKELFSVEKVTKEFFKKYRYLFNEILEDFEQNTEFQNIVVNTGISTTPDFVKKLMGQIVFLYFVQKKGWLGVQPNKNWGEGDYSYLRTLFENCKKAGKNYFNDYLEPLFYEALAEKRGEDDFFEKLNCRVPFLNGGLFESVYDWKTTEIDIHNEVLGKLLDFFDQYNFTVDENTPSDQEISVDPEMLGKIFEELLGVKDRKDKGAFYTPREIVHYMCRESLIQHLVSDNTAPEERIRKLFEIKDTDLSLVVENEEKAKNIKEVKEISEKIDFSLRNVKIVDPAVGSGAFPMGMLNEISSVRYYLNTNFLHRNNDTGKELSLYDIKKETLENCIYAVDLEPGAVEIAKLRFWLALIVEFESNDSKIAPPVLPNLDYKIMQGNSLLEEYEGVKLFDEKIIQVIDTGKEKQIEDLKKRQSIIQKEYFDLHSRNKLAPIRKVELDAEAKKIHDQLKKLNQTENDDLEKTGLFDFDKHSESKMKAEQLKSLQKNFFETNMKEKKEEIKKQIEKLQWELIEATLKEHGKISELGKIQEFKKSRIKPFFLWKLHFADVFEQKGGFDIVIGNPPYVSAWNINPTEKANYEKIYTSALGHYDLYLLFIEKAIGILKEKGTMTLITSNKFMSQAYGEGVRKILLKNRIIEIINFDYNAFETATVETAVLLVKKEYQIDNKINILDIKNKINSLSLEERKQTYQSFFENLELNNFRINLTEEKIELIKKIRIGSFRVDDICYVTKGAEIHNSKEKIGKDEFIFENKDKEDYKKYTEGKYIDKYIIKKVIYLNYTPEKHKAPIFPELFESEKLILKNVIGDSGIQAVYDLQGLYNNDALINCVPYYLLQGLSYSQVKNKVKKENVALSKIFSLKYMISVLNSSLMTWYYEELLGFGLHFYPNHLKQLPIKKAIEIEQKPFIELVDKILNITKTEDYLKNIERQTEVKKLEHQIDELVYKLYDLTPEEIEIVENSSKK